MIIGITGQIGTGKSTVASLLVNQGFKLIDVDKIGHKLLKPDSPLAPQIITLFGSLDRKVIASQVFTNSKQLNQLNQLTHPLIKEEVIRIINQNPKQNLVIEAALLFEIGLEEHIDLIIAILSNKKNILKRTLARGISKELTEQILAKQKSSNFFRGHCQEIIKNDHTLQDLSQDLELILRKVS